MGSIRVNENFIQTTKAIGNNFTVLTMSDFHLCDDNYFHRLYEIVALVESIKPSIICIPGDLLDTFNVVNDNPLFREKILYIISKISKIAPIFISFAAHDIDIKASNKEDLLKTWFEDLKNISNVTVFAPNEEELFYFNDEIAIGGFSLPIDASPKTENGIDIVKYMKPVMEKMNFSDITYNIMIFHSPDFAFDKNGLRPRKTIGLENVNLGVSGHNHGGLAPKFLEPLNIGLLSPGKELFPHNVAGLFSRSDEEFKVLISRGIQKIPGTVIEEMGTLGNLLYRLNQVYRPDIDLLSIEPKKKIYHM